MLMKNYFRDLLNESIRDYPAPINSLNDQTLVVGDLHGNAMKALYILLRYGVLTLDNKALFEQAWSIYDKSSDTLTLDDLKQFEQIINQATVQIPGLINFLGDEFADRGKNDYFMGIVLKKLYDGHVPYRIQLSNHSSYLLYYLETGSCLQPELMFGQSASLDNYIALKTRFPELEEAFSQLIEHAYKDHLSLIGYTQPLGAPFLVFTHAPIGERTLVGLAKLFGLSYDSSSTDKFIRCIDQINTEASRYIREGRFHSLLQNQAIKEILWNRTPDCCDTFPPSTINLHGHVGYPNNTLKKFNFSLDSKWGKPGHDKIPSIVLRTNVSEQDKSSKFYRSAQTTPTLKSIRTEDIKTSGSLKQQAFKRDLVKPDYPDENSITDLNTKRHKPRSKGKFSSI